MLRSVGVGLALVAALSATGCRDNEARSDPARDTSALTQDELGWVRAYSKWTTRFYDEPNVGPRAVTACRNALDRIGAPPTVRLEEAASRLPVICPLLERLGSVRRAQSGVEQVDDLLLPLLRDEQPLPLRSGVTDGSRADVVFSDMASDAVGHPVEVRCWDEKEWSRVVTESNAWHDDDDDPDELLGWPDESADLIHLTLEICNTMTVARRSNPSTWARHERIDAIDSIETLSHEIGHFLSPDASEAEVECRTIRSLPKFLARFGVTGAEAGELTELYRRAVYPLLDDEYTEGGCPRTG